MLEKQYKQLPDIKPLMAKALFAKGTGSKTLPAMKRSLLQHEISASHLKAYNRICGFKNTAVLPPTYLHMMVYPMMIDMFIDKQFIFKPMGIVHVSNEITQHRPVKCSEIVDVHCELVTLREVDKGYEFDTEARVLVGDELVWSSTITNMVITKKGSSGGKKQHEEIDWSGWQQQSYKAPKDIGREYAKVSGDFNPIHLYPLTAKLFGFPTAIAHGMWSKAKVLAMLSDFYSDKDAFTVSVKFKLPSLLPTAVNVFSKVSDSSSDSGEGNEQLFWARIQKSDKPLIEGSIKLL